MILNLHVFLGYDEQEDQHGSDVGACQGSNQQTVHLLHSSGHEVCRKCHVTTTINVPPSLCSAMGIKSQDQDEHVKVLRLQPPERGQTTLTLQE